jgi:hypothetical protein
MRNQFVNKKSELTVQLKEYTAANCEVLRSRMPCSCATQNQRYGIVAILNNTVMARVIRCRACAKTTIYANSN